jgi:hypothetical protein
MDEKVVSFTLNGKGEEIGMGVAFSGNGFRPCGGVFAAVSFNRKEKLRLILGGSGGVPFKYPPPPGYRGVGEAVLEAVKERDILVRKESILDTEPDNESNNRRFLCDFSDGEHGHELMAWAHRYYGSDASVHLGSGRYKQSSSVPKTASGSFDKTVSQSLMHRIEEEWSKCNLDETLCGKTSTESSGAEILDISKITAEMTKGFSKAGEKICEQAFAETMILASLSARKLLLHIIVATGNEFDHRFTLGPDDDEYDNARRFWMMIETSTSLRSAGWVGEAGAMAIAAEALGLGISSNETSHNRLSNGAFDRSGFVSVKDLDEGVVVSAGGIVQLLSSVLDWDDRETQDLVSTGRSLAASAEAAIGSDGGGGVLIFLLRGLQAALCKSDTIRRVIIAYIRRSVRQLAVVEYENDDTISTGSENEEDIEKAISARESSLKEDVDISSQPDARLTSFLTGLLLSAPVAEETTNFDVIQTELFEAWSVGLLSASLPWRMICAFTAAGILSQYPGALTSVVESLPTLAQYYARLPNTVARRVWAERAAAPVCSRYSQAMVELLCAVTRAVKTSAPPPNFMSVWEVTSVDAATPLPLPKDNANNFTDWETEDGWISSDRGWEIWTGTIERFAVDWKTPTRSAVRTLMEGGDGPPMLREGAIVLRGPDWDQEKYGDADGKVQYDSEKEKRDEGKKKMEESPEHSGKAESAAENPVSSSDNPIEDETTRPEQNDNEEESNQLSQHDIPKKKKKKVPSPKLPVGTVLSIESWNGVPGVARRVRWKNTGEEGVYRYGGDGGRYDLSHVEINEKGTRVRKRHPLPESSEQCAARHGFGVPKRDSIFLRLRRTETKITDDAGEFSIRREGILEWPEFGAGIFIECFIKQDGSILLREKELLYGSKDSGWEARFGQPSFVGGTEMLLKPTETLNQADVDAKSPYQSLFQDFVGTNTYHVEQLRNHENGSRIHVKSEMRITRCRRSPLCSTTSAPTSLVEAPMPPSMSFDKHFHASSLSLSRDGRTLSCVSSDGRGTAFANIGFSKGVHYWEVKLEQADIGSVFIGVAEKPNGNGSGSSHSFDSPPRLNRWHGYGFVNFRATYTAGAERIYGAHCHAGDTVGVLLDCDSGRLSFFFDGLKYGEHLLNDLGCAFENLSPFGFNVDGCGSGGASQGAPGGVEGSRSGRYAAQGSVRPRTLWPVVGLRNHGDRVTISSKWSSSYGVDGISTIRNIIAVDEVLHSYSNASDTPGLTKLGNFPRWFIKEAFTEYNRWHSNLWFRSKTRGSGPFDLATFGLDVDFDSSPIACATASALLGLNRALLAGDRVRLKRSAGRLLELAEEAVVIGSYQGRLYYRIVSQKSEGGSLNEGGGRAWCWDESEVVDGLVPINSRKGMDVELPLMDRFKCMSSGGLKIVFEGGAVVRSDLEIFDGSFNLGSIPLNTIIPKGDVIERRVNSCGVVRYRVRYESLEGWISNRIRGGKEEAIVSPVHLSDEERAKADKMPVKSYPTPGESAFEWFQNYSKVTQDEDKPAYKAGKIEDIESFEKLATDGHIDGLSVAQSDSFLARTTGKICNFCAGGDPLEAPFEEVAFAMASGIALAEGVTITSPLRSSLQANQASSAAFESLGVRKLPSLQAIMARVALIRALNRRARVALPWISVRPCQESSAMFGGVYGHGAAVDRAGRCSNSFLLSRWMQAPSTATTIRNIRGILFTSIKEDLLRSITETTTTPTPLSHDEYELPREIRTVRINRLRARRVMSGDDLASKRKYSVFAQLQQETKSWGGAALRRGFVAKGHGGQKRAFKVKLIGEGVNDYSGPYRETFTDALGEILNVTKNGQGSLGVLDPTPNNVSGIGENRDLYMFSLNGTDLSRISTAASPFSETERSIQSSFSSLIAPRDESSREVEEALVFLGRITGTAFRHGIPLDLPLPMSTVWEAIVEEGPGKDALLELDTFAYRQQNTNKTKPVLLWWQQRMLNSFMDGMSSVLPVEIFSLLSGDEFRDMICGNPEIDVDMLRNVVEYEGYEESDKVIEYFWETLREITDEDRKSFLQFVWARNRLPIKETDFDAPFKIQKDGGSNSEQALPSASTCFFSLTLPEYKTKEQLKEKLLFAINNVTTMETDFQTNSAEIAEGYRAI